ncbi:MAG: hypothetical protein LUE08_07120 [Akkermansiaceae bacterium]|nr:hypothetical protein [Akkermansiaceae bacterium]
MTNSERLEAITRILDDLEKHGFKAREHVKEAMKSLEKGDKNFSIVLLKAALWELYKQTKPYEFARNHVARVAKSTRTWMDLKTESNNGESKE